MKATYDHYHLRSPEAWLNIRTDRELAWYQAFFGRDFGQQDELILDVGAGNSSVAQEVDMSPEHKARIIRADVSYGAKPPYTLEPPVVAASALELPFPTGTFDRVISAWMFVHLGHERAPKALEEMLRVVKDGHEVMARPCHPLTSLNDTMARHYRAPRMLLPLTAIITKPEGFSEWEPDHRQVACEGLTRTLSWNMDRTG